MLKSEHAPENQNVVGHAKMVCFWPSYRSLLKQTREDPTLSLLSLNSYEPSLNILKASKVVLITSQVWEFLRSYNLVSELFLLVSSGKCW